FNMGEWEPETHEIVDGRNVYLWIVPAKVGGAWTVKAGERSFPVKFEQEFQMLKGSASISGKDVPVTNGRLRGADITFAVEIDGKPVTYKGEVSGNKIEGNGWSATRS